MPKTIKSPTRLLDVWIYAEEACSRQDTTFQIVAVVTRDVWLKLAEGSGIPKEKALQAVSDGKCTVQIFDDEQFTNDTSGVVVFKILNKDGDRMTIITIEQ